MNRLFLTITTIYFLVSNSLGILQTNLIYTPQAVTMTSDTLPGDGSFYHLDILDGKIDNTFRYPSAAGKGIDIYVIDSGISTNHTVFGGRAKNIANFVDNEEDVDNHGHGTHVAGIAAMVAKQANIIGIKVLDEKNKVYYPPNNGSSSWLRGIEFAVDQIKKSKRPSIISMSVYIDKVLDNIDAAIRNATQAGIPVFVCAGNDGQPACGSSPSHELSTFSVGNARKNNTINPKSNHGSCVDIIAPGTDILSASHNDTNRYVSMTGTSMATPIVSGIAAILMSLGVPASELSTKLRQITNMTIGADQLPQNTTTTLASMFLIENSVAQNTTV